MGSTDIELNDDDSATVSDGSTTETDSDTPTESDEERPTPKKPRAYEEGEKVLALFQHDFYSAKVLRILYEKKEWRYWVHYSGWNKHWDEWVQEARLRKCTDEKMWLQHLKKKHGMQKDIKAGHASQIKLRSSSVARGKKRKHDALNRENDMTPSEKLVNLQIPPTLKKQLVDDCEFITHLGKLVKLPRTPTVEEILGKYRQYRSKKDVILSESVEEIMLGLRCYFDKALPVMLLYKSERRQHAAAVRNEVSPSRIYGAEHLLRLFVKLPELLAHANIEEETLAELEQKLVDFLKFLQKNQSSFFLSTYHVPEDTETSSNKQDD